MGFCRQRDFLFCEICGTMLSLRSSLKYAKCPLCGFKRDIKEMEGKEITYTVTAEEMRRRLNREPFVQIDKFYAKKVAVQRAVVNEECPECKHPQLEYYAKQLRSADEGMTVFYECPKCQHKFNSNT